MKILITRPQDQAKETVKALSNNGFTAMSHPFISVENLECRLNTYRDVQGYIFTSKNAVNAVKGQIKEYNLPVYVVGEATAKTAKEAGFSNVIIAKGNVDSLIELLEKIKGPLTLLYCCGEDITADLAQINWAHQIHQIICYRTSQIMQWQDDVLKEFLSGRITHIVFASMRTVSAFIQSVQADENQKTIQKALSRTTILFFGNPMLKYADNLKAAQYIVLKDANIQGLLNILEEEKKIMANISKKPIENAGAIIEKFGGIRPMAAKIDAPVTTVQGWKKRDVIPGTRRQQIMGAAQDNNIDLGDFDSGATATAVKSERAPKPITQNVKKQTSKVASEKTLNLSAADKTPPITSDAVCASKNEGNSSPAHEKLMADLEKNNQKNMVTTIWLSVLVVLLGLAIALFFLWPLIRNDVQSVQADNAQIEEKIEQLETKIENSEQKSGLFEKFVPDDVKNQISALQDQTNTIKEKVQNLSDQAVSISDDVLGADAGPLSNRLAVLETKVGMLSDAEGFDALIDRIQKLENSFAGQGQINDAVKELQAMVGEFQNRDELANNLETAQASEDGALGQTLEGVSGDDLKAAAMLLAFSKFRDTLNRQEPFENDLQLLQNLVAEDNIELQTALARLAPQADDGVLTSAGLSNELKSLTGNIVFSSLKGEDVSIKDQALTRLNSVFQVKKEGEPVLGTETQKTVARAQKLLDEGNVQEAVTTLQMLKGPAAQTAAPIINQANMTLLAENVQQMISQTIFKDVVNLSPSNNTGNPAETIGNQIQGAGSVLNMDEVKKTLKETLPAIGQDDIVKDEESGLSILPSNSSNPQKFKGFSAGE